MKSNVVMDGSNLAKHLQKVAPTGAMSGDDLVSESDQQEKIDLSIVIPVLNESENLEPLHLQLNNVLDRLDETYEIIFIDDGSDDDSFKILEQLHAHDSRVRVVRFRRNFGQTAAFAAGFDFAQGAVIVTIDADLQNDPQDIPSLVEKIEQGYDVVSGWRRKRQDPFLSRRVPSWVANWLISKLTGVKLHDYGCSLKAYRREIVKNISLYGELHRFIPALASSMGSRVTEIEVKHRARMFGQSKYSISRTVRVVLDLITVKFLLDFATRPIQIFGLMGMLFLTLGTGLGLYLSILKYFYLENLADRPLLLLAILLIMMGVQLITMGLLGELVTRTYHETQNKPIYMVRERLWQKIPEEPPKV